VSLHFLDRLLPNVNVVPSRFLFPLGFRFLDRLLPNVNVIPSVFLFPLGLPYPNESCNKIGFDIELQINAIGIGCFLLPLPLKNRTCEFPRILLKWLCFEEARPATPHQRKPRRFAHPERGTNPSPLVSASL